MPRETHVTDEKTGGEKGRALFRSGSAGKGGMPHRSRTVTRAGWLRHGSACAVLPFILCLFIWPGSNRPAFAAEKEERVLPGEYLSLGVKTRRLFSSHTSFEFGNPFPPYQAPLSRLEFPLGSWWGGVEIRADFRRLSINVEALGNAEGDADGMMRDSDWDDEKKPTLQTIYSYSRCRTEPSYMVRADMDLEVSDRIGLPPWLSLRPVIGFRWQDFHLVTHDGVQYDISEKNPVPLPGDGIDFTQTFWHYFIGLRSYIDAGALVPVRGLNLLLQVDWAYVEGHNDDFHLLREGNRHTFEDTYGQAWHASVALKKILYKSLILGLEAEYLRIQSTGTHRLVNDAMGIDFGFSNGVRAWSEQLSVALSLEYRF